MFKFLSLREQVQNERTKNEALTSQHKELEDAVIELAEIVAMNEEVINNG